MSPKFLLLTALCVSLTGCGAALTRAAAPSDAAAAMNPNGMPIPQPSWPD